MDAQQVLWPSTSVHKPITVRVRRSATQTAEQLLGGHELSQDATLRGLPLRRHQLGPDDPGHAVATVVPPQPVLPPLLGPEDLVGVLPVPDATTLAAEVLDLPVELDEVPAEPEVDEAVTALGPHLELRLGPADAELEDEQPRQCLADGLRSPVGDVGCRSGARDVGPGLH